MKQAIKDIWHEFTHIEPITFGVCLLISGSLLVVVIASTQK